MARDTVIEVSRDLDRLIAECVLVEAKIHALEMKLALLEQKTNTIQYDVTKVYASFWWATKVMVGGLLVAVTGFIIKGGLV
jgi:hypothetical protein